MMDKFTLELMAAELMAENERLRDENRRMHLAIALLSYKPEKPKRGRKHNTKEVTEPANKGGDRV